jgi:putative transposase
MFQATKVRIYPTPAQQVKLAQAFGCARWFWNNSLAKTQEVYKATGKGLGQFALNARLPVLKTEFEWLTATHSQVLQSVSLNLSRSFVNFFERRARYPKFKSKHSRQTIQYPQGVKVVDGCKLYLPKLGHVKAVIHRELVGVMKTVTVSRDVSGQYYASILLDDGIEQPSVSHDGKFIGIDVGLESFAVTSDGSKFDSKRFFRKSERNLKRKQQSLSRKTKGSNRRNKARLQVAKVHAKVASQRKDYLHKLSRRIVDENQVIAVEDLNVKGMMANRCLAKSIGDAGWGMFTEMLKYKAARVGKGYIEVNRFFPSSKTCSCCMHAQQSMPLQARAWTCDSCGTKHDRDVNAAINIRNEAQRMLAAGLVATASRSNVSPKRGRKSSVAAVACEAGSPVL